MRCFACDCPVSGDSYDSKTDRFYCTTCIEPTLEEGLKSYSWEKSLELPLDQFAKTVEILDEDPVDTTDTMSFTPVLEYHSGQVRTSFEDRDYYGYEEEPEDVEL